MVWLTDEEYTEKALSISIIKTRRLLTAQWTRSIRQLIQTKMKKIVLR